MDLGRPKQATKSEMPTADIPALESVVRSHSAQLSKLNTGLSTAFSQVTGEMGEIKSSSAATASTVASLANQVVTLTSMLAKLLPAPSAETSPTFRLHQLPLPSRWSPWIRGGNPTLRIPRTTLESSTNAEVSLGSASSSSPTNPHGSGRTGPRWLSSSRPCPSGPLIGPWRPPETTLN